MIAELMQQGWLAQDWHVMAPALVGSYMIISCAMRMALFAMRVGVTVCLAWVCMNGAPDILPMLAKLG